MALFSTVSVHNARLVSPLLAKRGSEWSLPGSWSCRLGSLVVSAQTPLILFLWDRGLDYLPLLLLES